VVVTLRFTLNRRSKFEITTNVINNTVHYNEIWKTSKYYSLVLRTVK
jgi:hypothetical protein